MTPFTTSRKSDLQGLTLVIVTCAWLVGILLDSQFLLPSPVLLIGTAGALVLVILLWHAAQCRLIMLIILCLLLGAWRYSSVSPINDPQAISTFISTNLLQVRGTVVDEPAFQGHSRVLLIEVNSVSNNRGHSWQDAHGHIEAQTLSTSLADPYGAQYGDSVELQGRLQAPQPHSLPSIFADMAFPRISVKSIGGNPIIAVLYTLRIVLANIIAQSLPQPEAALLIAIVLGLRTPALTPLIPFFTETGTIHLIVPSGFKVTILAGLVASSTQWLYKKPHTQATPLLPAQKRHWQQWVRIALMIACIAAYTILSGAGPAAIRAGIMGTLLLLAPQLGRIYNVYTALALAALLMSLLDPFVLWDAGFQLSLLGTLGIVLLTPLFQHLLHPIERLPFGHYIAELIAVTLAAQTATLPIFASTFQQISFIAPIANLLTVPLLAVLILLGILICGTGLLFAPLALLCGWIAWPLLWYVTTIVTWCAGLPGAFTNVANLNSAFAWAYYLLLTLLTRFLLRLYKWPLQKQVHEGHVTPPLLSKRTWRTLQFAVALLVILATAATALAAQPDGYLKITFLSVAPTAQAPQGQAIFISTPDGKTILIDGGLDATSLAQELDSRLPFWQRSLDLVVLTTSRQDHLTALQDIVSRYQIGEVVDAGMLHPTTSYALWRRTIAERNLPYVQVHQGTTLAVGTQVLLQVLSPSSPLHKSSNEEQDNALVIRLIAPGLHLLLLGTTAQSKFALTNLTTTIDQSYLQANIVQIVAEPGKAFPPELSTVLQVAHPSLLLITPAQLSSKQRKAGETTTIIPSSALAFNEPVEQIVQTAQVGTMQVSSSASGWSIHAG